MASLPRTKLTIAAMFSVALLWSYWPVLVAIEERWASDPKYSHGYLIPLFALWLLVKRLRQARFQPLLKDAAGTWWSLAFLFPAMGLHLAGIYLYMDWLSEASLLAFLVGLCLSLGGWGLLRVAGPSIGFMAFMLPLPFRVEVALGLPLQRFATLASTYLLEMLGFCTSAEGNTIVLDSQVLNVVEACSGLGMMVTFLALAAAVAIVLDRPLLDRVVVLASAIPVALIANIVRITATGILAETLGGRAVRLVYHDLAGWFMMSLALILIWLELKVLSRLLVFVPVQSKTKIDLTLGVTSPSIGRPRRKKVPVGK
jgi:exosortase